MSQVPLLIAIDIRRDVCTKCNDPSKPVVAIFYTDLTGAHFCSCEECFILTMDRVDGNAEIGEVQANFSPDDVQEIRAAATTKTAELKRHADDGRVPIVDHPGTLPVIPMSWESREFLRMWRVEDDKVVTSLRVDAARPKIPDPYNWGCLLHDAAKNIASAYGELQNAAGERLPYEQLLERIVEGFNAEHDTPTTDVTTKAEQPS